MGVSAWIDRQLRPRTIDDSATDRALVELTTLRMPISEALREFPRPDPKLRAKIANGEMSRQEMQALYPMDKRPARIATELQAAKVVRAVTSERQLEELMVDFWFNHFNVFAGKGDVRWYVSAYEREAIRPYAMGKFPDLVRATAYHPAMLFYLDNWLSARPDFVVPAGPNRGRKGGLNENYAWTAATHRRTLPRSPARSPAGRSTGRRPTGTSSSGRACTTAARKSCSVSGSRPAAGVTTASA
jgi:hypothetical protein